MLDRDESQILFPWSALDQPWVDFYPMLDRFGCFAAQKDDIFQVFLARLLALIEAYAVDKVLLTVGSEPWAIPVLHCQLDGSWAIPVLHCQLDLATFENVLITLHLQDFDYVLPVVSLDLEVYLIMFEGVKNCENVCSWSRIFGTQDSCGVF